MRVAEIKPVRQKSPRPPRVREPYYPTGDGKPMAETPEHRAAMNYGIEAADIALSHVPDRWISGNDFLYSGLTRSVRGLRSWKRRLPV